MTAQPAPLGHFRATPRRLADLADHFDLTVGFAAPLGDREFMGLSVSTKDLATGEIFVALQGIKAHGIRFADQAVASGAAAILTDPAGLAQLTEQAARPTVPVLVCAPGVDLRDLMATCAGWFYANPSSTVSVAGVTGTNGKTTTCFFLDAILRGAGRTTGIIGTIEMRLGDQTVPAVRTTVEAPVLQNFLAQAVAQGVQNVSMEVSSHALSLSRVAGTHFEVVGFTNLQRDHLDFHHTMDEYFEAKAALFVPGVAGSAVINIDDDYGWRLARLTSERGLPAVTIASIEHLDHFQNADWRVTKQEVTGHGVDFELTGRDGQTLSSYSPLLGSVNVANAALATLMARAMHIDLADINRGLRELAVVPGRMEVVSTKGQPLTIVDYAHTTDALEFALTSLRARQIDEGADGKIYVVFGAAGERDAGKRPDMGRVTMELADFVAVTDDDPYAEDRATIRGHILSGARESAVYQSLSPAERAERLRDFAVREDAMTWALTHAGPADTVLIAGRGHETIQDLDGVQHELDDRVFAREILARRPV